MENRLTFHFGLIGFVDGQYCDRNDSTNEHHCHVFPTMPEYCPYCGFSRCFRDHQQLSSITKVNIYRVYIIAHPLVGGKTFGNSHYPPLVREHYNLQVALVVVKYV